MRLATSLLLAAIAIIPLAAQQPATSTQKRPITFADLMAMRRVSDPQISPSGKWVLFSVTDVSLEKNTKTNHLWVVPLDGSAKERQITNNTGESNGRFAPNGQFVMYTGAPTKDDPYSHITIATWDEKTGTIGMGRTLRVVSGDADGAIWSPDSKHFLFTTQVYPECSDKPTWAEEDACNKAKDDAADASPVKAQIFDHLLYRHWNAYTGPKRTHILEADFSLSGANPRDLTPRSVVGDAETPTFSLGGPLGYAWAPDSHEIAYETNLEVGFAKPGVFPQPGESTNNDIFTLKLDDPNAKAVKVSTSPGSDDGPQYSPDGKYLAWRSQARDGYESDKFDLVVMDRATREIKNLSTKLDNWIDEFVWAPNSNSIVFVSPTWGEEQIYRYDLNGPNTKEGELRGLPATKGEFSELQVSPLSADGTYSVVASRTLVNQPTELEVVDSRTGWALHSADGYDSFSNGGPENLWQLTHMNSTLLSSLDLTPQEPFLFAGANGTRVEGFLIKPPNFDASKKYPVKFLIHGGPQGAWGDAWSYRWNPELFAANGYVVVMINPRGSTGYGQRFLEEVSGDWGGRPYIDLMKGLDFAEAKYPFIDKNRECALGASYGGYMADWVLTHTNRFKCIVTHDGMSDPTAAFGTTEELWFMEWEFRPLAGPPSTSSSRPEAAGRSGETPVLSDARTTTNLGATSSPAASSRAKVGSYDADAVVEQNHPSHPWDFYGKPEMDDPYIKWSPMRFIKDAHTPTLIVHSQRDMRLDVSQGLELFTALQLRGVPSKMLYFPDEGHWVLKPQNSQLWNETVNDWCDRWLGMNKYASSGPEKNPAAVKP